MISAADTTGVFQLESSGFRELLQEAASPDCFEDIIAAGALYRPGPLEGGMVDEFIERKHGRKRVEYAHPTLEPVLKDTYGVFVYQEQVMQIRPGPGRLQPGRRRSAPPRDGQEEEGGGMAKQRAGFLERRQAEGTSRPRRPSGIFDLMEKFAGYGFNKSHSAAYGLITYQTAYLKRHYRPSRSWRR